MLPMTIQFLITMIACAINERQQKALEYKTEEVLILKDILKPCVGSLPHPLARTDLRCS
jgi:hypothetical protein